MEDPQWYEIVAAVVVAVVGIGALIYGASTRQKGKWEEEEEEEDG